MTNKELEAKVKELEEENQKLKADQGKDGLSQPLVLPDPATTPLKRYEEKEFVKVRLFKDDYRYKEPLFVGINGRTWMIPRGKEVELPKYVADFVEQQMKDEARIWERVAQEEKEYEGLTNKQV